MFVNNTDKIDAERKYSLAETAIDQTLPWTGRLKSDDRVVLIDGNNRFTLYLNQVSDFTGWNVRLIPQRYFDRDVALEDNIALYLNENSEHVGLATYWEKVTVRRRTLTK